MIHTCLLTSDNIIKVEFYFELKLLIKEVGIIKGYNIAKGKHVKVHVFKNQLFDLRY